MLEPFLTFPQIDPVALELGPLVIRWYALAYIAGILAGWGYIHWLNKDGQLVPAAISKPAFDEMVTWAVLSILIGGRLGYVFFYRPDYYLTHPLEIFYLWQGGMSFHGGLVGVLVGYWLFARRYKLRYLEVMDLLACACPIGLGLGRIANFINGELFGREVPEGSRWGVMFPRGGDVPRYPSQLFEAALEGLLLLIVLFALARFTHARQREGLMGGLFLAGYAVARMAVEQFREPDEGIALLFGEITRGQALSIPMLVAGLWLVARALKRPPRLPEP